MKKYSILIIILAMMLSLCSCMGNKDISSGYVSIYRLSSSHDQNSGQLLDVEQVYISDDDDPIKVSLDLLQEEPKKDTQKCAIPSTVHITESTYTGRVAKVHFNSAYKNLTGLEKTLTDYATVLTLTETGLIDSVYICCEGEIVESNLKSEDILTENSVISNNTTKIRLYFPDKNLKFLRGEYHTISINNGESIERNILEELVKGPHNSQLISLLPNNLLLLSVSTQKGVCTVSFSSEFLANDNLPSTTANLNIYSIVNSLSTVKSINSVQILVDGKKVKSIGGIIADLPLSPRPDLNSSMLLHIKK